MLFRIADTFTDSLAKLTGEEQKAVKTTAFDLQISPANPGMKFHKLNAARDPNFWSVRVSRDIRLIVHRSTNSLLLCYVDHHDKAYQWAERRKLETHPKTGAAQLVEIRARVQEIAVPTYVAEEPQAPIKAALFENVSEDDLLAFGVPADWLGDVRNADEDQLLEIADHLPGEAAEALLELAIGGRPQRPAVAIGAVDPFDHPDAQRRFRVMADADELALALEYPWEKWAVFLHPAQRDIVEKDYNGPARVSGSAGTGKTIVALHRAVHLARSNPDARVLLTTFSDTLANALRVKLRRLISNEPRLAERLEVHAIDRIGERLYEAHVAHPRIATREHVRQLLVEAMHGKGAQKFGPRFLLGEWEDVVDAWQLQTWEDYRDVKRLGRKTRLSEQQRLALWEVFEIVKRRLGEQGLVTRAQMFSQLAGELQSRRNPPFDFAVIDEAQDIGVAQLRFLAALGGGRLNALFFAGDLGQRIFQTPFSWKSLGVDVRGRSQTLRINYRTSHQIRKQADRLLGPEVSDVDGNVEDRRGTVSVFNGPEPDIRVCDDIQQEIEAVGEWIAERVAEGIVPHEIGIFVRSGEQLDLSRKAAQVSKSPSKVLDEHVETTAGQVAVGTMHLAKGLEFRAVVVMACDDEVIPLQERVESVADDADLREVYETERHLLYVACTRARDHLLVTGVEPASEFLEDLCDS
jgi:superfamily I DNA/RNA helicase/mRNA-degrading endonuclease RelE of RelBE toxin-antitoxin system